jgi:hypothetical protein
MRMRRLEDELERAVLRPPRPDSPWRFGQPLLLLTVLVPNFVLAFACLTDQGPWTARGYFGPGTFGQTLYLLSPLVVWAAGWLLRWEGDYDIVEPRTALGLIAGGYALFICLDAWISLGLAAGTG